MTTSCAMCPVVNRREVIRAGIAAMLVAGAMPLAQAGVTGGCTVALRQQHPSTGIAVFGKDMSLGTGSKERDQMLGRALVRMSRAFGVRPTFGFYDDSGDPNAYASEEVENDVPGTWGKVRFGRQLHAELIQKYGDDRIAVLSILAHEFAHVAQYQRGAMSALAGRTVKRAELHADMLSGYYLGLRKIANDSIKLRSAGMALYSIGDFAYNDPQHHGAPQERIEASEHGFALAREQRDFADVFNHGVRWIVDRYSESA